MVLGYSIFKYFDSQDVFRLYTVTELLDSRRAFTSILKCITLLFLFKTKIALINVTVLTDESELIDHTNSLMGNNSEF